ncbi:hypothetical protein CBR_g40832 [Chara braunii]|uniref:Reverse transcriptase/retrotransposon-derived protein RNase H-like domain-containing protein n=1 Tax=Chara braunii TaxID=69332 RepID=A0A388LUM8_CHABU|nr:hypothetical protein CBR_g40832 [Chara braunii]|eukprot:GBG86018.1 hypothetical protein CBR_g40832 [Chara braunii]
MPCPSHGTNRHPKDAEAYDGMDRGRGRVRRSGVPGTADHMMVWSGVTGTPDHTIIWSGVTGTPNHTIVGSGVAGTPDHTIIWSALHCVKGHMTRRSGATGVPCHVSPCHIVPGRVWCCSLRCLRDVANECVGLSDGDGFVGLFAGDKHGGCGEATWSSMFVRSLILNPSQRLVGFSKDEPPVRVWRRDTRGGTSTKPYSKEEEEKMATILRERKEKKGAKKKALQEEQAAKLKKIEEEMAREKGRIKKEEEEKLKEVEEKEEEDETPLQRKRGQYSGNRDDEMEKWISEWVANLSLGEEEEVAMYIPKDDQEAAMKAWDAEEDVIKRQAMEDEKRMEWKLAVMTEKKRRVDAAADAAEELEEDFARELGGAVGAEVGHRLDKTERFCVGAIEGVKAAAPKEEETHPRREPVKVKFPDSYSGKWEENFDDWEANVKTYVHLQEVSPDQHVLIAIHALRDEAASFARSLVRAANCNDDAVAYSSFTPLVDFLKLLRERFADVARSVKASDRLQTIHSRQWKSARALKSTIDELVVLEKLREANFKINAKKCEWAKTQVLYLGHVLDGDCIKLEDSKIAAIRDWPTPHTLTELWSFLGLANYYRKFVRNFSTIAAPLRRLLRKETIWKWDKDCTSAMKKLKQALIEYPVLKVVDPSLPFVVITDASQYGIGAVLQQDDGHGYRPVEFMSARMPSEKVATSTYERELYALRQALEHWKHYLLGRHFKVYSDHETLRWLKTQAKMTPKLTRWAAEIDQYDFELKPVKGKYNVVADALSRRADYFGAIVHYLNIGKDQQQKIREAYAQDPIYSDLLKKVKEAPETEPNYRTTEGLLFEKTNVFDRLCIPNSEEVRSLILGECHDTEGHFGWQKTSANLMRAYMWPGMKNDCVDEDSYCDWPSKQKKLGRETVYKWEEKTVMVERGGVEKAGGKIVGGKEDDDDGVAAGGRRRRGSRGTTMAGQRGDDDGGSMTTATKARREGGGVTGGQRRHGRAVLSLAPGGG